MTRTAVLIVAVAMTPGLLWAQTAPRSAPPDQVGAVEACRSIAADGERLACFDKAAAALATARAARDIVVVDRAEVTKTKRGLFGFKLPDIKLFDRGDDARLKTPDVDRLEGKVAAVRALPLGRWRMVLDDGGVWETTESDSRFGEPRAGSAVVIERKSLGSYFIKLGRGLAVRARRTG